MSTYDTTVLGNSPLRYFPLNEASGTVAHDLSGHADGTLHGGVTTGTTSLLVGDPLSTAMTFNDATGYITFSDAGLPAGNNPWTMECWIKPTANDTYPILISYGDDAVAGHAPLLWIDADTGTINIGFAHSTNLQGPVLTLGTKYYVVGTFDGTYLRLFVNGVQQGGNVPATGAIVLMQGTLGIHTNLATEQYGGVLQKAAVYGSALTQTQIDTHCQSGNVGTPPTMTLPTDGFGIYDYTGTDMSAATYQPRLQQMAAAGLKLVMNYSLLSGSTADMIGYINYAASLGMKVIVNLKEPWIWLTPAIAANAPTMYAESGNQATDNGFTTYVVNQVKNLPGTRGYYVGDEPGAGNHAALALHSGYIHAADATKPRLIIENWTVFGDTFYTGQSPMWDICEYFGDDIYPLGTVGNQPSVYVVAKGIQDYATAKMRQSAIVLQAFSVNGTDWPLSGDIASWLATTLTFMQTGMVLFYSYHDIQNSADPTLHWNNLVAALATVRQPLQAGQQDYLFHQTGVIPGVSGEWSAGQEVVIDTIKKTVVGTYAANDAGPYTADADGSGRYHRGSV